MSMSGRCLSLHRGTDPVCLSNLRREAFHLWNLRQKLHQPTQHEEAPQNSHRREALPLRCVRSAVPLFQHAEGPQGEVLPSDQPSECAASCPDPTGLSSSCSRSGRGQHSHQPSPCSQYEPRGCCASLETRPAPFLTPAHTHASTPRAPPPHPSCASPAPTPSPLQEWTPKPQKPERGHLSETPGREEQCGPRPAPLALASAVPTVSWQKGCSRTSLGSAWLHGLLQGLRRCPGEPSDWPDGVKTTTALETRGTTELKPNLLAFSDDFYKFQILWLWDFIISYQRMRYACFYISVFSSERGGPVSFILIGKAVRLVQSINYITVYCNEFGSAFGAGCRVQLAAFHTISSIIEKMGIFFFV